MMIDLHCHLLPGIDDGPKDLSTSLEMARIAVADGITTTFCTPHIYPGLYENTAPDIRQRVASLQLILQNQNIPLKLSFGADVHLVPGLLDGIRGGRVPTLGDSRYLLLEPSHHVCPPRFCESVFELIGAGYVPVITHPERLTWAHDHMDDFFALARSGAWMQVTAGALTGKFGARVQRLAERFVGDGWTAVLATDAHTTNRRAPLMREAFQRASELVGADEATRMVAGRPQLIVLNKPPNEVALPPALVSAGRSNAGIMQGRLSRWFSWRPKL